MRRILLFISLLAVAVTVKAQLKNDSLEYRIRPDSLKTGELYLSINNFNYLRNYEFYNEVQDGYTLYGAQLEPQLVYYAHPNLAVMAGIHLRKDFGGQGIYKTYPLFSIKYQKKDIAFITGVLEGNIQHRFIEPLFDFEQKINNPIEYGTQFTVNKPSLFLDAFINWKRMIYKPSPDQEQIVAGISSDIRLAHNDALRFSVPLQLMVFHQGGQIDVSAKPLQTLLNTAFGLKLEYAVGGFIQKLRTENYFVGFNEMSPQKILAFSKGHAYYFNGGADTRYGTLLASYWNGSGYISPIGMPIFQSVSQHINHTGEAFKNRSLLFIRYAYQKALVPNLYLDFRVEPVMDLNAESKKMEFYHSLFLVYKQEFRLGKGK